jgi:hypothetical protein
METQFYLPDTAKRWAGTLMIDGKGNAISAQMRSNLGRKIDYDNVDYQA